MNACYNHLAVYVTLMLSSLSQVLFTITFRLLLFLCLSNWDLGGSLGLFSHVYAHLYFRVNWCFV